MAPGEHGKVVAKYSIGDRYGAQTTEIFVETDDPETKVVPLKMELRIPKAAVETGSCAGEFEVVVTPAKDRSLAGQLRIELGFPKEHPKAIVVPVQVALAGRG